MWAHAFADDEDVQRRMNRPENEIPTALPMNRVLVRTPDLAVALLGLRAYTTGVAFELVARARGLEDPDAGNRLSSVFWERRPDTPRFLLGVEFADGRRASNLVRPRNSDDLLLHSGAGSGGDTSVDQEWWLSPLPPDGPLRVVLRCPEIGIEETVVGLDGTAIRRAGESAVVLWPWEPPRHQEPAEPTPPDLPAGSWFAG